MDLKELILITIVLMPMFISLGVITDLAINTFKKAGEINGKW